MQVAALHKHPEEVGDHKVVEDGGDAAAPDLHVGRGGVGWREAAGAAEQVPRGATEPRTLGTQGQGSKHQLLVG